MSYRKSYKKVKVDKAKLRKLIKVKGLTEPGLAAEMGYGENYFYNKLAKSGTGEISLNDAKLLEALHDIKLEDYELKSEVKVEDPEETVVPRLTQSQLEKSILNVMGEYQPVDYERMYKVMYSAMYEAMSKALKGE